MAPLNELSINGSKMIAVSTGFGTGDTVYHTADGYCWRSVQPWEVSKLSTGETVARRETKGK